MVVDFTGPFAQLSIILWFTHFYDDSSIVSAVSNTFCACWKLARFLRRNAVARTIPLKSTYMIWAFISLTPFAFRSEGFPIDISSKNPMTPELSI